MMFADDGQAYGRYIHPQFTGERIHIQNCNLFETRRSAFEVSALNELEDQTSARGALLSARPSSQLLYIIYQTHETDFKN